MLMSFYDPIYYKASTVSKNAPNVLMTDIFRNYKKYFDRVAVNYNLTTHYIQGAPRPEQLANTLYGNSQLYWVLLFANGVFDSFHDWIKSQTAVYQSIAQVYKDPESVIMYHINERNEKFYGLVESSPNSGKWFHKGDKEHMHQQYDGALVPINAYEDAILENEYKRKIRIISPADIERFITDLVKEMEKNA